MFCNIDAMNIQNSLCLPLYLVTTHKCYTSNLNLFSIKQLKINKIVIQESGGSLRELICFAAVSFQKKRLKKQGNQNNKIEHRNQHSLHFRILFDPEPFNSHILVTFFHQKYLTRKLSFLTKYVSTINKQDYRLTPLL